MTGSSTSLAQISWPRTGKRGVPQQFPRRLYEMLETETKRVHTDVQPKVISWSESGKAFRIFDVTEFANTILPKYFRTKKFSSFQRNLNLYGFTKVRRGPDSDMYAHPSFLKDRPELLLVLRKITGGPRRRAVSHSSESVRPVSPSGTSSIGSEEVTQTTPVSINQEVITRIPTWAHVPKVSPVPVALGRPPADDRGKLDLLALALERATA